MTCIWRRAKKLVRDLANVGSSALSILICVSIGLPPNLAYARGKVPSRDAVIDAAMSGSPFWEQFKNAKWSAPKMGPFNVDGQAKLLDLDPYYLRSQGWLQSRTGENDGLTRVSRRGSSLVLEPSHSIRALKLDLPFAVVGEDDDFIFLQSTTENIFREKVATAYDYGEGLFFVDKQILNLEARRSRGEVRPVPIFFLPLSGEGWTRKVLAAQVGDADIVSFRNSNGESATFLGEDIRQLSKAYRFNLLLATLSTFQGNQDLLRQKLIAQLKSGDMTNELPFAYPAKGSTTVFGVFYSGIDLDHPERSIPGSYASHSSFLDELLPKANANPLLDLLNSAQNLLAPDVVERLKIVGWVTGTVFVASVLSKYTVLKGRNLERRNFIEKQSDEVRERENLPPIDRTTRVYKAKREVTEWIDFFTHGLASISSIPGVLMGHILEYGADFLWTKESKFNRLTRKALEATFIYQRVQNESIASNAQSFYLGVLILGGIDTSGVILQLLLVSPLFFPWVAQAFGPQVQESVSRQFSGQDAASGNVITSEIMRNLSAYFVSGAYSYASTQRQKIMEDILPVIQNQMKREGLDPFDPKNDPILQKKLDEIVDRMLIERGLPSQEEFLFGSPSIVRAIAHLMGFQVDRARLANEGLTISKDQGFLLEAARWGLVRHSLKAAIASAEELYRATGDNEAKRAAEILRDIRRRHRMTMQMVKGGVLRPKQTLAEAKEARQDLALMSYDGELIGTAVKYVDGLGAYRESPKATELAARLFRQSLFSVVYSRPHILQPSEAELNKFREVAGREAKERLKLLDSVATEADETPAEKKLEEAVLTLEVVKEKIEAAEVESAVREWRPAKRDWLEARQSARAHHFALDAIGGLQNLNESTKATYVRAYRQKMAQIVGLREMSDQSDLVRLSDEVAAKEVAESFESNKGLAQYYNNLGPIEQIQYLAESHAKAYLERYMALTVSNSTVIELNSPEQPGRFQRMRQIALSRGNKFIGKFLNMSLRTIESVFDNTAFKPGLAAWRARNIPFYTDVKAVSLIKGKTLIPAMTAGYVANYYLWQVTMPWDTYLFFFTTGAFTYIANFLLDRIMINNGIRPMDSTMEKIKYSVLYTWLTYPTYIPFFFFKDNFESVSRPIMSSVATHAKAVWSTCSQLLGGG